MFSAQRIPEDLSPNRWTRLLREARERARENGEAPLDLAVSNPTAAGFLWRRETLATALASDAIERYAPHPRGNAAARDAVAEFYRKEHRAESVTHMQCDFNYGLTVDLQRSAEHTRFRQRQR